MFFLVKSVLSLLTRKQLFSFLFLQILTIASAIFEIVTVILVAVFFKITLNPQSVFDIPVLSDFLSFYPLSEAELFQFSVIFLIILLFFSTIIICTNILIMNLFLQKVAASFQFHLYRFYINQDYLYFIENSPSKLIKHLTQDHQRFVDHFFRALLIIFSRLFLCIFIFGAVAYYNFTVAIISTTILIFLYFLILVTLKSKIGNASQSITQELSSTNKIFHETIHGIKDIIFYNNQTRYEKEVELNIKKIAKNKSVINSVGLLPKTIIEFFGISAVMISIALFFSSGTNADIIISSLALYVFAGYKILPAVQNIYHSYTEMQGSKWTLKILLRDYVKSNNFFNKKNTFISKNRLNLLDNLTNIKFSNIDFKYYGQKFNLFENFNISFSLKQNNALVGLSGSGKSTILDLLLGFIKPDKGKIFLNDQEYDNELIRQFRKKIGYVPQNITLLNDTIRNNIIFSSEKDEKYLDLVYEICGIKNLFLNFGIDENKNIGEFGSVLSGGQRQRIGLARALYRKPSILILDEATSSLDGISESKIFNSIKSRKIIDSLIVISHNFQNLKNFDNFYLLNQGKLEKFGNFEYMYRESELFKNMFIGKVE
jgi:HlyD family secretion protein